MVLLGLLAAGCAGINVKQDYDPSADFSRLRTFNWQSPVQKPVGNELVDSTLLDSRIRAAVERELVAKGHRKTAQAPDYLVAYSYTIKGGIENDPDTRVGVGVGRGSHSGGFGSVGVGFTLGGDYEQDTLIIDIIDPASNTLIWRGFARQRSKWHSDPEANIARINEAVTAILREFPPQQN